MGSVYEVEDTTVGKRYVLKTLNVGFAEGREALGLEQMMRREARALARVAHPHIVDVITAGKTADRLGLPYIVMEKLDGVTVRTMLQSLSFPRQSVWQIASELLDALYHLHHPKDARVPMLHRDIKPENIFLAKTHEEKYVTKLLDLGIAVMLDGEAHGVHGTPAYMAPEQFRNEPLTEQTDLYQAACVIFEMLTGRHPFYGAKSGPEWIEAHLWRDPPRVSEFVEVPQRVDDVLLAALSKLPSKRPRDAYALIAGLHPLRDVNDASTPITINTTVEDLHTAIEKRGESAYFAYATGSGTIEGVTSPPLGNKTLEDAYPSFALASTEDPTRDRQRARPLVPAHKGQTVPMAPPREGPRDEVDRSAPTRSLRYPALKRSRQNDTEELADCEIPARSTKLSRPHPNEDTSEGRSDRLVRPSSTPFAAAITGDDRRSGRRGHRIAVAASAMILLGGIVGASAILRSGDGTGDGGVASIGSQSNAVNATPAPVRLTSGAVAPTPMASVAPVAPAAADAGTTPVAAVPSTAPALPSSASTPGSASRAIGAAPQPKSKPGGSSVPAASRTDYTHHEQGRAPGHSSPSTPSPAPPAFDGDIIRTL
jgi:serine/threonine-protein kinase